MRGPSDLFVIIVKGILYQLLFHPFYPMLLHIHNQVKSMSGSQKARRHMVPYQAGICRSPHKLPICGGTVLTKNFIVTAAHCFDDDKSPSNYRVNLGDYDVTKTFDGQETFHVSQIKVYPGYKKETYSKYSGTNTVVFGDVALLRLAWPATFNARVGQICLPSSSGNFLRLEYIRRVGLG